MVDGLFVRSMAPTAANRSTSPRRRKLRYVVTIAQHLEVLRTSRTSEALRDALSDMAMRLVDDDERDEFEGFDGPTMIVDHLSRITEEQATLDYAWRTSNIFETTWEAFEVHESLVFSLVLICHASIEESIAIQCLELGASRMLWELYVTMPKSLELQQMPSILLSALRNLCYVPPISGAIPHELVLECWRLVFECNDENCQVLAAEVLTNMASHGTALVNPTRERLAHLVEHFFKLEDTDAYLRIAILDLLTNLCVEPSLCLLVIYELDARKPRKYRRHSGAVFFIDLTESQRDPALKQSMEALAHNISWSDPAGKRTIQKLGLSSYMARFALELAINN